MAEFPVYEKTVGFETTPQPNIDASAQMLINNFKQFSSFATQVTGTLIKGEVEEQRDVVKNNISNSYRDFAQSSLQHPDQNVGLADYNKKAEAYGRGLLAETNPFNKRYVENLLNYYSNEHRQPLVKNAMFQNKRVQQTDFILRNADSTNDVLNAVQNSNPSLGEDEFHAADSLHIQQIKAMKDQVALGRMTPSSFDSSVKELRKQLITEKVLKKYKDSVSDGRSREYLASLIKTNIPGFDSGDKAGLFLQINKINDQHLIELGLTHEKLNEKKKNDLKNIEENGALPNVQLAEENAAINPEDAGDYDRQQKIAKTIWSIKQAAQNATPAQLEHLKTTLRPTEPNAPGYIEAKNLYDRAFAAVEKQAQDYRADPMAFDKDLPFVDESSKHYQLAENVGAIGTNEKNSPLNSVVTKPWDSIIAHQQARGLSIFGDKSNRVKLLTNLQAQEYVRLIEQSNPRQKVELFNKIKDDFDGGVRYNLVMKQLNDLGLNKKMAFLGLFDATDPDTQNIADAMTLPTKDLGAALKSKNEGWFKNVNIKIADAVYNGNGGSANFKNYMDSAAAYAGGKSEDFLGSVEEVTQSLAYHYLNTGVSNSPADAVKRAQDTLASRYTYTSIHNQVVNVPKNYDPNTIKSYAIAQEPKLKEFPFVTTRTTQGGVIRAEQASGLDHDLIMRGHWVGGSNDHGLVWVDFNGRLPTDKDGHPFYFNFKDAQYNFKTVHPTEVTNAFPNFLQGMVNTENRSVLDFLRAVKE